MDLMGFELDGQQKPMSFLEIFDLFAAFMINNAWLNLVLYTIVAGALLWLVKPWRMKDVAAAVFNIPLVIGFGLLYFLALIPALMQTSNRWEDSPFMSTLVLVSVLVIPVIGYLILKTIDKDREKAPKNEFLHKILNGVGIGLILVFFLWMGFTGIVNPMFIFEEFSLRFVALFFVFTGTVALFARFVLAGLLLALGANDPYVKVVKPYIKWIYVAIVGSALLGFSLHLIDQLI